jgi:carbon-monoxide dehydrogenase iron sulfur subunit
MKMITTDLDRCVGCRNCEYACSFIKTGDFKSEQANICVNVYPEERFVSTLVCSQCETPYCLRICPCAAIRRDHETHAVVVDALQCMGCRMCMQACPFGNIFWDVRRRAVRKCDLCDGDPNCVKFCMTQALDFVEVNDLPAQKRKDLDHRLRELRLL